MHKQIVKILETNNKPQKPADSANKSQAQEVDSEDEDLIHEHLEPGLNIEAQKEIEKEQQENPTNEEAEDYTANED